MKNSIFNYKFLVLFACLTLLSFNCLQAQTTIGQAEITTALSGSGLIDITGDLVINGNVTAQNSGMAKTLTIKASGNVSINGNLNVSGVIGDDNGNTVAQRSGNSGHNLIIDAKGTVTVAASTTISTNGGNGVRRSSANSGSEAAGGAGGNAGSVEISGSVIAINGNITANGGDGGGANFNFAEARIGLGGQAGNITIKAETGNVSTGGIISASSGNAGTDNVSTSWVKADFSLPDGKDGGIIQITSNAAVTIGGAITANGGSGIGQATNRHDQHHSTTNNKSSTDGGKGGTINIASCLDLTITATVTANGGTPGIPIKDSNPNAQWGTQDIERNTNGHGGAGGSVTLASSNGDISATLIRANGEAGAGAVGTGGDNDASGIDRGGYGGAGGTIAVTALKGTANGQFEAKGGNGGNYVTPSACAGSGGTGGNVIVNLAQGTKADIENRITVSGGTVGAYGGTQAANCTSTNGTAGTKTVTITPYTPPTLGGQIDIDCDADGDVVSKEITRAMLDNYLANYAPKPNERWEISLDGGSTWTAIAFPFTITNDNKADYEDSYLRLIYTECGVDVELEKVLISIPCVPVVVPPVPDPEPQPHLELRNAIIWGGSQAINHSFLPNDEGIESLLIFNRYGTKIFEGTTGWDGTYKGKAVEPDNYYYVLKHTVRGEVKGVIRVQKE